MFVYNGVPAAGNPPVWQVVAPGVTQDPFGNTVSAIMNVGSLAGAHAGWDANGVEYLANSTGTPVIVLDPNKSLIEILSAGLGSALTASMTTPAAGTDDFGASFQGGFTSYHTAAVYAQLNDGQLTLKQVVGHTANLAIPGLGSLTGYLAMSQASGYAFDNTTVATGSLAFVPGSTTTIESWHNMTLLNGWANVAGNAVARYRYVPSPFNCVQLEGVITAAAATSGTFFTLPAGYVPASAGGYAAGATSGVTANTAPQIRWDTSGNLTVNNVGIGAANPVWITGLAILDA
jgi:hypothetical protein